MGLQEIAFLMLAILVGISEAGSLSGNFTFTYSMSDIVSIPFPTSMDISSSLATSTFEQIQSSQLQLIQKFQQLAPNGTPLIPYNIVFFNMSNPNGSVCYYNFFSQGTAPPNATGCPIITSTPLENLNVDCINLTGCISENFNYSINLNDLSYRQSIFMIQNINSGNQTLYLNMSTNVNVVNSNTWFYWSVALTCCLLLSLVLLTGVVLYWSLKYRKAQRSLQEMRLTEVDEEVTGIRKSLRKSTSKEE